MKVEPKLSHEPLRPLQPLESREQWLVARLANTLAEITVPQVEWEAHFGRRWPGPGYRKALEIQREALRHALQREIGEAVEC